VEAGKDAYCEKPMATDFAEAKAAYLAVKQSRQVVQIGTQRRSDPGLIAVAKLLRAGVLGKLTRVDLQMKLSGAPLAPRLQPGRRLANRLGRLRLWQRRAPRPAPLARMAVVPPDSNGIPAYG